MFVPMRMGSVGVPRSSRTGVLPVIVAVRPGRDLAVLAEPEQESASGRLERAVGRSGLDAAATRQFALARTVEDRVTRL